MQEGVGSIATESRKEPSGPAGEQARPTALDTALREARHGLGVVAALSLFLNLLVLVSPLYMFQVFDRVLSSGHVETLVALTVLAGFALLVFGLLETIRHQTLVRIGTWLDRRLSEPVLAACLGAALSGRALGAEPLRDLARLRAFISSDSVLPVLDAPWTLVFILVIWLLHPWLGVPRCLALSFCSRSRWAARSPCGRRSARPTSAGSGPSGAARQRCAMPRSCTPWACSRRC